MIGQDRKACRHGATACNTSERASGEGFVDASSRQIIGRTSPHTVSIIEQWSKPPESPNMRMSAPLFDYGKAVRSEPGEPRAVNTVASSSQCQPPRFGLERRDVGEQVTRDKASALGPRLDQGTLEV